MNIAQQRLHNQGIAGDGFGEPLDVVRWLGAVQGQEYRWALWAIGLRMRGGIEADVEQAIADRKIVRTWFMRGTLHFVPAADIRWMMALMSPRMRKLLDNTARYNKLDLDEGLFARSNIALAEALRGGRQLMRPELAAALEQMGIAAGGLRLSLLLQRAQADGIICYGTRRGKQVTFALLDEWVPPGEVLEGEEAPAEFARRYFTSHGPATLQDFVWWSGLTTADARAGLEMAAPRLGQEVVDGQTYWFSPSMPAAADTSGAAYLLPFYDEYAVGYRDRGAVLDAERSGKADLLNSQVLNPTIVIDGRVVGTWKRTLKKDVVVVETSFFDQGGRVEGEALVRAAERYGRFLGLPATIEVVLKSR